MSDRYELSEGSYSALLDTIVGLISSSILLYLYSCDFSYAWFLIVVYVVILIKSSVSTIKSLRSEFESKHHLFLVAYVLTSIIIAPYVL